ncbi:hypothetical protein DPM19_11905 [Actinomadura craniellae]|uniref:Uncharacterized protein n=2 Tax=Actinomadura craniellae TaxID=2231787 RepID=A0A365H8E2_9ACTN|nr:hypothetical protein DPM19_11905 [Actinomadura craniellae]
MQQRLDRSENDVSAGGGPKVLDVVPGGYAPVRGFDGIWHRQQAPGHPRSFREYLVLRDEGRSAVWFSVRDSSFDLLTVTAFLEFLGEHRDLAFDGLSHHKEPLPRPVGRFGHALFCSPSLGGTHRAYPEIENSVAKAFPVFDCEIGDADTEAFVDARLRGTAPLPYSDWDRAPHPVIDLRYEIGECHQRTFKAVSRQRLDRVLDMPADAGPDAWLELRSFRGDLRRATPDRPIEDVDAFLLGTAG